MKLEICLQLNIDDVEKDLNDLETLNKILNFLSNITDKKIENLWRWQLLIHQQRTIAYLL